MKKAIVLFLIFFSCKKEVYYYPSKQFFEEYKPKEIIVDNMNFREITDSIRNGVFRKENYFITLKDSKSIFKISPFTYTGGLIKEKNALEIVNDSIYVSINKYPLPQLGKYMKLHYENNGKEAYLPDSYKKAFIKLVLNADDDSKKLNNLLLTIIKTFNKTNIENKDSINLAILINYYFLSPPPPVYLETKNN